MSLKLITELTEEVEILTEETNGKKNLYIEGPYLQSSIKNKNSRIYPKDVMANEVNRYIKEHVDTNRAMGELGHPANPSINLDRVSHRIVSLKESGNDWIGKSLILNTPTGNIAKALCEGGTKLGVSSRGLGSMVPKNGINEVQNDFRLVTAADIVADPSAPSAFVNGIMEGVEYMFDPVNQKLMEVHVVQAQEHVEKLVRSRSLNEENVLALFNNFLKKL